MYCTIVYQFYHDTAPCYYSVLNSSKLSLWHSSKTPWGPCPFTDMTYWSCFLLIKFLFLAFVPNTLLCVWFSFMAKYFHRWGFFDGVSVRQSIYPIEIETDFSFICLSNRWKCNICILSSLFYLHIIQLIPLLVVVLSVWDDNSSSLGFWYSKSQLY